MPDAPRLLPQHLELIRGSAISEAVAEARGYRSVSNRAELERHGFTKPQRIVPCLLVPVWSVHGEIATYQIRPDTPRIGKKGKPIKYETPKDSRMVLDVPPPVRRWLGDPSRPLFVTEGVRKADAASSLDLCCIALLGVWNWRGRNVHDGRAALPDWEAIALNDRDVFVVFDSDAVSKPEVRAALARLREFLQSRGAHPKVIELPPGDGGRKTGLDDYIAAGHGVPDLLGLVSDRPLAGDTVATDLQTYESAEHGLLYNKPIQGGFIPVQLTNFTARITTEIRTDDGAEQHLTFEIEASLKGRQARFTLAAKQFSGMNWPLEHLGAEAIVYPGSSLREHARTAIQLLSPDPTKRRVFAHLGWRQIEDQWLYLHVGGAIGPRGLQDDIEVALPEALQRYVLPAPPEGSSLRDAIRASLGILEVAPDIITVPLLATTYRAPLGHADFTNHMTGDTGEGKTALALLAQQHFGAGHDAEHVPASWISTGNALEAIAFCAKDALLLVDDFVPKGSQADLQRLNREAERLLRAQANAASRQRMRPDTTLRPAKPPRGLLLSTGEEVPRGKSLRARLLVIEVETGSVNWDRLTVAQAAANSGLFAQVVSAYVQWLARKYDQVRQRLPRELGELREQATRSGQHRRTPAVIASVALGLRYFIDFSQDAGALTPSEAEALWIRGWRAMGQVAGAQAKYLDAEEPTRRFLDYLTAAISSGRAHVASRDGAFPTPAVPWGWRRDRDQDPWHPLGDCIGWIDDDDLYLESEAAFTTVQRQARDSGEAFGITVATLRRRLHGRGYLLSTDPKRETLTVRRTLAGVRRDVLHLRASRLMGRQPDQPDQDPDDQAAEPDSRSGRWSGSWSGSADPPPKPDQETRPEAGEAKAPAGSPGRVGRVCGERKKRPANEVDAPRETWEL